MTRAELIEQIVKSGVTPGSRTLCKADAEAVLRALGPIVQKALAGGDHVGLPGIGKLVAKTRAERAGRNPKTGEALTIPACVAPRFIPAAELKSALKS